MISDFRFAILEWRFSKSANGFIFSPETADNRYGEVCHAGAWSVGFTGLEPPELAFSLALVTGHRSCHPEPFAVILGAAKNLARWLRQMMNSIAPRPSQHAIAVGIPVTRYPPHGSVRALLSAYGS